MMLKREFWIDCQYSCCLDMMCLNCLACLPSPQRLHIAKFTDRDHRQDGHWATALPGVSVMAALGFSRSGSFVSIKYSSRARAGLCTPIVCGVHSILVNAVHMVLQVRWQCSVSAGSMLEVHSEYCPKSAETQ